MSVLQRVPKTTVFAFLHNWWSYNTTIKTLY